jgi:hypothetical protein
MVINQYDTYVDGEIVDTFFHWMARDVKYSSIVSYETVMSGESIEEIEKFIDSVTEAMAWDKDTSGYINGYHFSKWPYGVYYSFGTYSGYTIFTKGDVKKIKRAIYDYKNLK